MKQDQLIDMFVSPNSRTTYSLRKSCNPGRAHSEDGRAPFKRGFVSTIAE